MTRNASCCCPWRDEWQHGSGEKTVRRTGR